MDKYKWKITLEAPGFNKQVLTSKNADEQGITSIVNLIIGWLCMFHRDLFKYVLKENKAETNEE